DALATNPDDRATHAAYADLLSEEGDPRGEFIAAQLALEDESLPAERWQVLRMREKELLAAHQRAWLGALAPGPPGAESIRTLAAFRFRRGWLDTLHVGSLNLPLARASRDAPQARLLRDLALGGCLFDEAAQPGDNVPKGESRAALWPLAGSAN